ncbi:MAG: hypothetical protein PHQ33_08250, partial [Bacteroidales bacterium]|nr:hypothetical protein [Bacteroidales bacterium]
DFHIPPADYDSLWSCLRCHWMDDYAQILLPYHPEYQIYKLFCNCHDNTDSIADFDRTFATTFFYADALNAGLWNPASLDFDTTTHISNSPDMAFCNFDDQIEDPYFKNINCCEIFKNKIKAHIAEKMSRYITWNYDDTMRSVSLYYCLFNPDSIAPTRTLPYAMDSVAAQSVINIQNDVIPEWATQYECTENDARWRLFQSVYQYLKQEAKNLFAPTCLFKSTLYSPNFSINQEDYYANLFPPSATEICNYYLKADTACTNVPLTVAPYPGFQIRYLCQPVYALSTNSLDTLLTNAGNELYDQCLTDCNSAANDWMRELDDFFHAKCPAVFANDSTIWKALRDSLTLLCHRGCDTCLHNNNFAIGQLIDLEDYAQLLTQMQCPPEDSNYVRIVYRKTSENLTDCGCNNYQNWLNNYDLSFWSDTTLIRDALQNDSILIGNDHLLQMEIGFWNHFCIWSRYDSLLFGENIDSLNILLWNEHHFPDYFRCNNNDIDWLQHCEYLAQMDADAQNAIAQQNALDNAREQYQQDYSQHCIANISESLSITHAQNEFLYTLYYYDQADNLIKTVPPEGVKPLSQTELTLVQQYRNTVTSYKDIYPGFMHPEHKMIANTNYNTLNQVITNFIPDHDNTTTLYYDILSRPVISQNAQQKTEKLYSYTLYDELGRIVEVGQLHTEQTINQQLAEDNSALADFINSGEKSEITRTYYDFPLLTTLNQNHLRNRIACITFHSIDTTPLLYRSATHYSYDIHGNVQQIIQNIPDLKQYNREFIRLNYQYDLISGKVNSFGYQQDSMECWGHRYRYDADNRLTHVYTSQYLPLTGGIYERPEAQYFYLPNGLLTRIELGKKQIQGIDYAYTLQGWLKNINAFASNPIYDIGHDNAQMSSNQINAPFACDAYSQMLQYNKN